jgi:hypothetical protein
LSLLTVVVLGAAACVSARTLEKLLGAPFGSVAEPLALFAAALLAPLAEALPVEELLSPELPEAEARSLLEPLSPERRESLSARE